MAFLTLVRVPTPWYAPRVLVTRRVVAAVAAYAQVRGLSQKVFLVGSGEVGGMYEWASPDDAAAWFSPEWHERIRRTYGRDASIETAILDGREDGLLLDGRPLAAGRQVDGWLTWAREQARPDGAATIWRGTGPMGPITAVLEARPSGQSRTRFHVPAVLDNRPVPR